MKEWIVSSSVLILAILVVRLLFRGRISQRLQYALWSLVLLRLLIPISFLSSPISVLSAAEHFPTPAGLFQQEATPELEPQDDVSTIAEAPKVAAPLVSSLPVAPEGGTIGFCTGIWLTGMVLVGGCLLASNVCFARRLRRERIPVAGMNCPLPVYVALGLPSPCLFGLIHPAIYLTPQATEMGEELHYVLAHELTHYRHGDPIWAVLRGAALILHWYNPLVWAAAILSRRDGELACDEGTTRIMEEQERLAYGRTLVAMATGRSDMRRLLSVATTMSSSKGALKERVLRIAKKPQMLVRTLILVMVMVGIAAAVTFTGTEKKQATLTNIPLTEQAKVVGSMFGGDGNSFYMIQFRNSAAVPYFVISAEEWRYGKNTETFLWDNELGDPIQPENGSGDSKPARTGQENETNFYISCKVDQEWTGVEWEMVAVNESVSTIYIPIRFQFQDHGLGGGRMGGAFGWPDCKPVKIGPGNSYVLAARAVDLDGHGVYPSFNCETLFNGENESRETEYGHVSLIRLTVFATAEEMQQEVERLEAAAPADEEAG